ncbi:tyrosine-protein phosphatase [Streptococcus dentasini]
MNRSERSTKETEQEIICHTINNLRDLGGYKTIDGKTVKHRLLFRGPALTDLSQDAKSAINSLELKQILDLRSEQEALKAPDYIPQNCAYMRFCASVIDGREVDLSPEAFNQNLFKNFSSLIRLIKNTINQTSYNNMSFSNPAFHELFQLLENQKVPLYFHCSAGKDRTGLAALLILLALGVSKEVALDDFEFTNHFYAEKIKSAQQKHRLLCRFSKKARLLIQASEGVSRQTAEHALQAILDKYDTFENYFYQEFGLDEARLKQLRQNYTT